MKLALIGIGQAGGKVVDQFLRYDHGTDGEFITSATAINTARTDLHGLEVVPSDRHVLIGHAKTKGHGVGADNELGAEIAKRNESTIRGALDGIPLSSTDAFLVVAALGGGTGSGGAPVIARQLRDRFSEPVYGLGILPSSGESGIYTLNAARSFRTFVNQVDNLLVFDNDAWREPGTSIEGAYEAINQEIARRFGVLFSAGEIEPDSDVAESVIDSSEIINTLDCGGVTSVGYAAETVSNRPGGLLDRFRTDGQRDGQEAYDSATDQITSLVRTATMGRLTLPCRIESTHRAAIVVSGPPDHLTRLGIDRGREWLVDHTGSDEIRSGDYPMPNEDRLAAVVMLSGVTDVPRIDSLQETAADAQERLLEDDEQIAERTDELLRDDRDAIDPLF